MVDRQHLILLLRTHTVVNSRCYSFIFLVSINFSFIFATLDTPSSSNSSSSSVTTTLPRYKTLLDKFSPTIPSSLPTNEQRSTTITTAASIVSNSNTLIRNYYENLCNSSSASSTATNNRKKRSISNEYDCSSTDSTINENRNLAKRFRPMQSSTGNRF